MLVVVLLDGRGHHPGDADAVAAHDHDVFLAVLVQIHGMHGVAVLGAQLEDVAHFDALGQLDGATAARAGVAQGDAAQVGVGRDLHVAAQVNVHQMRVSGIGAHHVISGTL